MRPTTNTGVMIETGARLHFGLLDLTGDLGRVDGSLGVALTRPRLVIKAFPANDTTANVFPRLARLAVQRLNRHYGLDKGLRLEAVEWYPRHVGLGSTTQILLSIATAYGLLYGRTTAPRDLARIVGRGGTSGVGVAAFETGGLILDAGHSFGPGKQKQSFLPSRESRAPPPPVLFRAPLPADWVFDVIVPRSPRGLSGKAETRFFQEECPVNPAETSKIAHIILSCILPAVLERDIETFLRGINALATLGFKKKEIERQSETVKRLLDSLTKEIGTQAGVGMSSFGPTLFIIGQAKARRHYLRRVNHLLKGICPDRAAHYVSRCRNVGRRVRHLSPFV